MSGGPVGLASPQLMEASTIARGSKFGFVIAGSSRIWSAAMPGVAECDGPAGHLRVKSAATSLRPKKWARSADRGGPSFDAIVSGLASGEVLGPDRPMLVGHSPAEASPGPLRATGTRKILGLCKSAPGSNENFAIGPARKSHRPAE